MKHAIPSSRKNKQITLTNDMFLSPNIHETHTLADLSTKTWEEQNENVELLEDGWKEGMGIITCTYSLFTKRLGGILKVFLPNTWLFITPKNVRVINGNYNSLSFYALVPYNFF